MPDRPQPPTEPTPGFLAGPLDRADQELVLEALPTGTAATTGGAAPVGGGASRVDLGRRTFFRRVAGELVQTAANLTGAATVAHGAMAGAAAGTRELTGEGAQAAASATGPRPPAGPTMEQLGREHLADGVRPWTWDGERLLLLDQRRLPATAAAFPVASAGEAARAVAERVVAGPAAAIVAAWGLALTADGAAVHAEASRAALIAGAERSLLAADPGSYVLRRTVTELAAAMRSGVGPRATAGRIEDRMLAEHAALADRVAALLVTLGVVAPLLHGPSGALWGGGAGTALDAVILARPATASTRSAGPLRPAAVTEGRPWLDGARITAWELVRRDIPVRVVTDAAAPGAIVRGEVDAVLLAAERVAADGSVSLPVGALGLALAAAHRGIPFLVVAAPWSVDAVAPDAVALVEPGAPTAAIARFGGTAVAPPEAQVDATRFDVVPSALVTHLVTLP